MTISLVMNIICTSSTKNIRIRGRKIQTSLEIKMEIDRNLVGS